MSNWGKMREGDTHDLGGDSNQVVGDLNLSLSSLIGRGDLMDWRLVSTNIFLNCSLSSAVIYKAVAMTMV